MKKFLRKYNIDFIKYRYCGAALSLCLIITSLFFIIWKGFHYGIDFRGGTIIQIKFEQSPDLPQLRTLFQKKFQKNIEITTFGNTEHHEILVTCPQEIVDKNGTNFSEEIKLILSEQYHNFSIRRIEKVGPKVGELLKEKALQAILYALIGILIYIWLRFKLIYGMGAIIALFHDVIITLGIFTILDKEINLTIVAAVLTIVGYSLNDTIVVFDRIRENRAKLHKKELKEIINLSINESLSRTILTSLTTMFVILSLFVLGGEIIHDFSFAMIIGIIVGTYSSIFIASPILLLIDYHKKK